MENTRFVYWLEANVLCVCVFFFLIKQLLHFNFPKKLMNNRHFKRQVLQQCVGQFYILSTNSIKLFR